ncbi:MAG TPA: thioredoxin-like domain-containing protein [Chitinophagaceae bacterium]|nr:thioredoxin-like domain-containing protein [Chitinophagaceae bacterium]
MKKILLLTGLLWAATTVAQEKPGYEIKVTFKPFKNQNIYLGHYFGKSYPIIDSVKLNDKSEAIFKGSKKLNGGIYLIGYPGRTGFFEILVDKQQHFSVLADTATIAKELKFVNSPDNELFNKYQQFMTAKGKFINELREKYKSAANKKDSTEIIDKLTKVDKEISDYRTDIVKKYPNSILTALLQTMREPELTGKLKSPKSKEDSLAAWQYFKTHYWDGVNFWDGRMAYTTFFEEKLDKYFNQLVVPHPDSVIKEMDWMLGFASLNEEMNRFLLLKFVNRYLNQKYMWEDAVFVHLFEKYFSQKTYPWLNENGKKIITERAYSLMANIMGSPAADIELPDTSGKNISLYKTAAPYTVVVFWDPTCGHCKEVLPKLDSFYTAKWKAAGLKIFAVAKETDGTRKTWIDFVTEKNLWDWTHVYYSKAADKARVDTNVPGYSQLFDVLSFPTLYLLDKDKRIVAKKLSYEQIDDVLQLKMKGK